MNEQSKKQNLTVRFIIVIVLLLLCIFAGKYISPYISEEHQTVIGFVMLGIIALVFLLALISHIGAKLYFKKNSTNLKVREMTENLTRRKELAVRNLPKAMSKIVKWRRIYSAYMLFLFAAALLCGVMIGISQKISYGLTAFPIYLLLGIAHRFDPILEKPDFSEYSDPKDFPRIYDLAHKAARALNMDGEIKILFTMDCNAGIAKLGKVYSLHLGVILLDAYTEDELYQVLLHEFAHMTKDGNATDKENRLYIKINAQYNVQNKVISMFNLLFALPDAIFMNEFSFYRYTASEALEVIADNAVTTHGDPRTAANGLAKIAYYHKFSNRGDLISELFYEPEEMRKNMADVLITSYRAAVGKHGDLWKEQLMKEIQPRNATHPILRLRMQSMGVSDFTVTLPDYVGEYREECVRAREKCNEMIYRLNSEDYAQRRKMNYLTHAELLESWEAKGKPITNESSRAVLEALWALTRYDELEALCDDIINNNENLFATAHAHLLKGIVLLNRYDDLGIGYLYKAMEINENYIEEGLSIIGDYCCANGLQKELDEYRERAVELSQANMDQFSKLSSLMPEDDLVYDTMPEEMLNGILDYIESISEQSISRIYLVRKVINESFFGSCFVIRFKEQTHPTVGNRVMDKIFNHLDTHPVNWHFSLFVYTPDTAKAVAKVQNSCVWDCAEKR